MKIILGEEVYPYKSADGDPLPAVLYHGTTKEKWDNFISKRGLDPKKTENRGEHTTGYTFLAWEIEGAEEFAPGGVYYRGDELGVILEVQLDAKIASKIRTALGEYIRCPVLIPPSKLRVVKVTNQQPAKLKRNGRVVRR